MPFTTATISFPNTDTEFGCRAKLTALPGQGETIDGCGDGDDCGDGCEEAGKTRASDRVPTCVDVSGYPGTGGY